MTRKTVPKSDGVRPLVVLVTGTATGVGKTWVAARTVERLRTSGLRVAARKPVQSFAPGEGPTDAEVLAAASGEPPEVVCPPKWSYAMAMAPPMAAAALARPSFSAADLLADLSWPPTTDVGVVEGVGGPRSPLADDGDTRTLADLLAPDVLVLVADAGLGVINAVRLSVGALEPHRAVVVLNRYDDTDPLHRDNRDWLVRRDGLPVLTGPDDLAAELLRRIG